MRLAAALLLIPAAAEAGLAGTYAVDCADPPFESRLRIEGDTVRFYESTCRMTNPVPVRDMAGAVLYVSPAPARAKAGPNAPCSCPEATVGWCG